MNGLRLPLRRLLDELAPHHDLHLVTVHGRAGGEAMGALPVPSTTVPPGRRGLQAVQEVFRGEPVGTRTRAAELAPAVLARAAQLRPDVVHVFSGRLAGLGPSLRGHRTVLSAFDAWHLNAEAAARVAQGLRRVRHLGAARRAQRFQQVAYRDFDRVVVVTDEDRLALEALGVERTAVIPNGVAVADGSPAATGRAPHRLVFHGVLSYPPNVDAACYLAEQILPRVRAAVPDATLHLVGRTPAAQVRDLGDLPGVRVVGEVPDVGPHLAGAAVYVCPMRLGTGIKNKLLEAMAAGAPCVATPLALQGIHAQTGREVMLGTTADELAAAAIGLLEEPRTAARLGAAGQRRVRRDHSWAAVARTFERLYVELAREYADAP